MKKIISLITDYGCRDPYVGVVKAVIKSINPDVEVIDLTHSIERHDVFEAAIVLTVSAKYFPPGTIFIVVVDPGVGSERKALLIETRNYILIGPDNGCLSLLAETDGIKRVIDISNSKYRLPTVSSTFHGRDIFAPIAAWASRGIPVMELGVEIDKNSIVRIPINKPKILREEKAVEGEVLYVDIFGNIMTSITRREIEELSLKYGLELEIVTSSGTYKCTYESTFSKVSEGALVCYINSWDYFEIAVNKGNAAEALKIKRREKVIVRY